jgi:hypothetical protein
MLSAHGMDAGPTEPAVHVTLPWIATQVVPSPELAYGDGTARFGLRWQVTPILFSWGVHRGLSPWRFLVAEPYVRQSGSIELYATPEYVAYGSHFSDGWVARAGLRSYFPLIEHGEYLSVSVGTSTFALAGQPGVAYEAGAYVLFGTVGVQVTAAPSGGPLATIATLRIRYF